MCQSETLRGGGGAAIEVVVLEVYGEGRFVERNGGCGYRRRRDDERRERKMKWRLKGCGPMMDGGFNGGYVEDESDAVDGGSMSRKTKGWLVVEGDFFGRFYEV